ncbi:MAG: hypothetical protein ACR2PA_06100 [Hyphomicrobiaceae bacterium]
MVSLSKLLLAAGAAAFGAYVFHNEPNAAEDPPGAIYRASQKLATTCDRLPEVCDAAADIARGAAHAARIGWGVATGEGRLVYIKNRDGSPCDPSQPWSGGANVNHRQQQPDGGRSHAGRTGECH